MEFDAKLREARGRGEHVGAGRLAAGAKRDDVGVFEQQQHVADASRATIFRERSLQLERVRIGDTSEPSHVEISHSSDGSNVSICCLTTDMN